MTTDRRESTEQGFLVPEALLPQCVFIETTLARLESTYQKTMLESTRTESELIAEYLVAHADDVLAINERARTLEPADAKEWLAIIHQRIDRLIYLRRAR